MASSSVPQQQQGISLDVIRAIEHQLSLGHSVTITVNPAAAAKLFKPVVALPVPPALKKKLKKKRKAEAAPAAAAAPSAAPKLTTKEKAAKRLAARREKEAATKAAKKAATLLRKEGNWTFFNACCKLIDVAAGIPVAVVEARTAQKIADGKAGANDGMSRANVAMQCLGLVYKNHAAAIVALVDRACSSQTPKLAFLTKGDAAAVATLPWLQQQMAEDGAIKFTFEVAQQACAAATFEVAQQACAAATVSADEVSGSDGSDEEEEDEEEEDEVVVVVPKGKGKHAKGSPSRL